jgi:hypothetical protein
MAIKGNIITGCRGFYLQLLVDPYADRRGTSPVGIYDLNSLLFELSAISGCFSSIPSSADTLQRET